MRRTRTSFFRQVRLLDSVDAEDLDALESRCEAVTVRKKHNVWNPGDPADRVYFVKNGIVKIGRVSDQGRELTLSFHTKGDLFGEVAAFSPGPHETVAEAYEDVQLLALTTRDFLDVMRRWPDVAMKVTSLVFDRRQRLENRVGALLFKTAHARLASLFLDLALDFGVRDSRGIIINLKLTHKEMASLIGATRETVSFAILDLRRDGLIETESKRVVILDEEKLRELVKT
jgi:CRP/FNR family cyclic AMP-dependent transcriptional regulator